MKGVLHQIQFSCNPYLLNFKMDAGTSRGVLKSKTTYLIKAVSFDDLGIEGWGEAGPLPLLSIDDVPDFHSILSKICKSLSRTSIKGDEKEILDWVKSHISAELPSVRFAFETALLDLLHGGKRKIFDSPFYNDHRYIPINGLIWMGDHNFMLDQIDKKLDEGFDCIKLKIGAIDFAQECELLSYIRSRYDADQITLRVDANGAFAIDQAMEKLKTLAQFDLHSIEQPIKAGQIEEMVKLCAMSPLPIALDEELIGIYDYHEKKKLLETINPQYIILKPTLVGGITASREWISLAKSMNIGWWMTSALESNIGLNAIAQFTDTYDVDMPQGLGTGQLYHNNFESPLEINKGKLLYDSKNRGWDLGSLR